MQHHRTPGKEAVSLLPLPTQGRDISSVLVSLQKEIESEPDETNSMTQTYLRGHNECLSARINIEKKSICTRKFIAKGTSVDHPINCYGKSWNTFYHSSAFSFLYCKNYRDSINSDA